MSGLIYNLTWAFLTLQGVLLLIDAETRNHFYRTISELNSSSVPFLRTFAENSRLLISFSLLPCILYPKSWLIPKFIAIIGYVFFICLNRNPIFFNKPQDIKYLLVELLLLGKAVFCLVDDMLDSERSEARSKFIKQTSNSSANNVVPKNLIQPKPAQVSPNPQKNTSQKKKDK